MNVLVIEVQSILQLVVIISHKYFYLHTQLSIVPPTPTVLGNSAQFMVHREVAVTQSKEG